MSEDIVIVTSGGFAFLEKNNVEYSQKPTAVQPSDIPLIKKLLVRSRTNYLISRIHIDNDIENKMAVCRFKRRVKCENCLHGVNELNDCDLLKEFLNV